MRALLIVNPHATSTTRLSRDAIAATLAAAVELETMQTRYRGHAIKLAGSAAGAGYDLVITLGGDGTVNEAVNGLLRPVTAGSAVPQIPAALSGATAAAPAAGGRAGIPAPGPSRPALAVLPGGSGNVFARALGLPRDPLDAARQVAAALAEGRYRNIGLGLADGRYFVFSAGLGIDAEVVRAVEGRRAHGRPVSPALYTRMALRQFYRMTDRRHPAISAELDPQDGGPLFWCTVSNTTPWTYLGRRPVTTNPEASFDSGLDLFGLRSLGTASTVRILRQMLARRAQPRGPGVVTRHDLPGLTLTADRPVAFQIDGEYVGERETVRFVSVPHALRVVA